MMQRRAILLSMLFLVAVCGNPPVGAAAFADPAFARQWGAGEAVTPNFWGPVANAAPGQQEPYAESANGRRLVQYFDKGRMELTNGSATSGLLATELVTGRVQVGDNAFESRPPPATPVAGDADNAAPTYVQFATTASALLAPVPRRDPQRESLYVTAIVDARGRVEVVGGPSRDQVTPRATDYDAPTMHNVVEVFAAYRTHVGFLNIGNAISEPFRAEVKVGGVPRRVIVQLFERRVLTYTESNPEPFKVEMGNIGQHYDKWRYPDDPPPASIATPAPAPTSGALDSEEADFLARINAYRAANGLGTLSLSPTLTRAAEWMSADMAAQRRFDHTDSQGRDPFQRMCTFGYCAQTYKAENIAAGEATAAKTFDQWKNSPGHDTNMRNPNLTVIGIARAPGTPGAPYSWYWTTDFGGVTG